MWKQSGAKCDLHGADISLQFCSAVLTISFLWHAKETFSCCSAKPISKWSTCKSVSRASHWIKAGTLISAVWQEPIPLVLALHWEMCGKTLTLCGQTDKMQLVKFHGFLPLSSILPKSNVVKNSLELFLLKISSVFSVNFVYWYKVSWTGKLRQILKTNYNKTLHPNLLNLGAL